MSPVRALGSFRARLTIRWTLAAGLLLLASHVAVYVGARALLYAKLDRQVRTLAATEAASATDGPVGVHLHEPSEDAVKGGLDDKAVQIFDASGRVVVQSIWISAGTGPMVPPDAVRAALAGQTPVVDIAVNGRRGRASLLRADRDQRPYAVAVGLFTDDVESSLADLAWLLAGVWFGALGLTATIGYHLASRALEPVVQITARAAHIARGAFSARLDPSPHDDEVGRMTTSLNVLIDRLSDAIEANRRFAADASHELRGPITAMAGQIDVTLRHDRTAGEYRDVLVLVRERLSALTALIEDLILLVRATEGGKEIVRRVVPLRPFVEAAAGRLAGAAHARAISIQVDVPPDLVAFVEPRLLARVVDNVIGNAVKYNREGGHVCVTARAEAPAAGDTWSAGRILLRIADTGPGIPEADRERIFERFLRLDHSRARHTGGSGLGLAISREVLAILGGTIRVAESSADGTTMEIGLLGERQ
ncbi:MAG: sensor histidine kinase [Vicinamibacterales bacterium]